MKEYTKTTRVKEPKAKIEKPKKIKEKTPPKPKVTPRQKISVAKKKIKKAKPPSRSRLIKKLDQIFSRYIRLLYADKKWMVQCVTSGKYYHWKEIQNWHFVTRWNYKYRRDETNCHPQSMSDNIFLKWNYIKYTLFMIKKYWHEAVEIMTNDSSLVKVKTSEILEKTAYYEQKVKELALEKGIELK